MVMKKKAQAAMEFLMTYGWAILVVLVVIGALAYFGVLNPQNLLPEKCTLPMGLYCKDHRVDGTASTVNFKLENGMGQGLMITSITITGQVFTGCTIDLLTAAPGGADTYNLLDGWWLANGDSGSVTVTCTSAIPSFTGKTKGDISLVYCSDTVASDAECLTYSHTIEGDLLAKVE